MSFRGLGDVQQIPILNGTPIEHDSETSEGGIMATMDLPADTAVMLQANADTSLQFVSLGGEPSIVGPGQLRLLADEKYTLVTPVGTGLTVGFVNTDLASASTLSAFLLV
jgi:hypothetical protein